MIETPFFKLWRLWIHEAVLNTPQELKGNDKWLEHLSKKCKDDIKEAQALTDAFNSLGEK